MSTARQAVLVIGGILLIQLTAFTGAGLMLFERYRPNTAAMEPTVQPGDRIWARSIGDVDRGDVVLLVPPLPPSRADPRRPPPLVITRVVGLGGDTVEAREGQLRVNGRRVPEPYLDAARPTPDFDGRIVPPGHVFFLGDNRSNSVGSPHVGPAPLSDVRQLVRWIGAPSMGWVVGMNALAALGYLRVVRPPRPRHRSVPTAGER